MDLKEKIKTKLILNKNNIRLDLFIKSILFSEHGYYYNSEPIGKKKDFVTAPEISQMFGEIIGSYLLYIWKTRINSKFNLIELGPGKGTLFMDIVNSTTNFTDFLDQAKIKFIEINKSLIEIQKRKISKYNFKDIKWYKNLTFKSDIPNIIYSNEFFDCFPVRQFFFNRKWHEKYVGYNEEEDKFYFIEKIVKSAKLLSMLNLYKEDKLLEISFERNTYFEKVCKLLQKNGGVFFTVDYGYVKNIKNFTLQAVQNHKFSHLLENIGQKDVSSHVNFNDFINIAKKYNLKIDEFSSQKKFLIKYGIFKRKDKLLNSDNSELIESELNKLISDKEMGNLFKVLVVSNL